MSSIICSYRLTVVVRIGFRGGEDLWRPTFPRCPVCRSRPFLSGHPTNGALELPRVAGSASGNVTVFGAPWPWLSSADSWITIAAGLAGTDNGSVSFSAPANTVTQRTGTLTIGGQNVSVPQAGGPPVSG